MSRGAGESPRPAAPAVAESGTAGRGWRLFGEGVYHARGVVLAVDAARVASMVARGLTLAPQSLTPDGTHPVTLLFGRHSGVHPNVLPIRGGRYREFLLAVPYLRRESGGGGPFASMPRLYLSSWLFVALGWAYAYPKWRARIEDDEAGYRIRSLLSGRPRIEAGFTPDGPAGPVGGFPHFASLAPIFAQPFVQRFWWTPWICSIMQFDLERASVRSVSESVDVREAFVPGLPVGSFEFRGIDAGPLGAFHIEVPWRLSLPMGCGRWSPGSGSGGGARERGGDA